MRGSVAVTLNSRRFCCVIYDVTIAKMSDSDTVPCPQCGATVSIGDAEPLARVPCPECGERLRATRFYNHFELRETLGTGGMGTVYKAHDMQLDRDVALKLLRKDLGPEYANQLQHEARITASINHPHVVQVFSFGRDHDQYYLVMELVDCGTLDDQIAERKKLPEEEVVRTGIEVARGLRAAYKKGLIHRDVKPANILYNEDGMAKISDFGLAGIVEPPAQTSGAIWGTPYYVAPERLNNQPEDFRSDIYSLGATLFHAVAGRPPFDGETMSAADLRALQNNPLKLKDVASETKNKQPIYDWASLNQAIAALLDQQDSIMHQALHEVENAGTNNFADRSLGTFLLDIAKRANARSTVALSDVPDHAAKPFALFLLGLTDVQLGRFNDAEALLTAFVGSRPQQTLSWIGEYKPIARKYLADSQDILKWREQYSSAKTMSEITRALNSLQDVIGRLQKNTAISAEALLWQKTLAARLRGLEAPSKSAQGKQHRALLARETPQLRAAVEAYQQLVAKYDFAGAAALMREVTVTEPSLQQLKK